MANHAGYKLSGLSAGDILVEFFGPTIGINAKADAVLAGANTANGTLQVLNGTGSIRIEFYDAIPASVGLPSADSIIWVPNGGAYAVYGPTTGNTLLQYSHTIDRYTRVLARVIVDTPGDGVAIHTISWPKN